MKIDKKCLTCGREYVADRSNSRFCSRQCKHEHFLSIKRLEPKKEISCGGCGKIFSTFKKGHLFCSKDCRHDHDVANGRKRYDTIRKSDRSTITANLSREKHLSSLQKELIYGSLLGDSSLSLVTSNSLHTISFGHAEKQFPYLLFKIDILDFLFQAKPYRYENIETKSIIYSIKSISHQDLSNMYHLFYINKKRKITYKTLNLLSPTSLLIWYLDDGTYVKRFGSCRIATCAYSMSEVKMLSRWFWKKHLIKTTVQQAKKTASNGEKITYYNLYILKEYTPVFFNVLMQSELYAKVPNCMMYKLTNN